MKRYPYMPDHLYIKYSLIWKGKDNSLLTVFPYIKGYKVERDDNGCVYITKGVPEEGNHYPCFAAHLDTVHADMPKPVLLGGTFLISTNGCGIGGDDKCGLVACLELLEVLPYAKAVFFTKEEVGGLGAKESDLTFFVDCAFVIEIDRKGSSDLIQESGAATLCSDVFAEKLSSYGFIKAHGLFTDANVLSNRGVGINLVNVSAGYYNAHSGDEYVNLAELRQNIHKIVKFALTEYKGPRMLFKSQSKREAYRGDKKDLFDKEDKEDKGYSGTCKLCNSYSGKLKWSTTEKKWLCETCFAKYEIDAEPQA